MSNSATERVAADYGEHRARLAARGAPLPAPLPPQPPSGRDENWHYAQLRSLSQLRMLPRAGHSPETLAMARAALPEPVTGFVRHVLVDGLLAPELGAGSATGLSVATVSASGAAGAGAAPATAPAEPAAGADGYYAALNRAFCVEQLELQLAPGAAARCELLFVTTVPGELAASHPAVRVRLGHGANLSLLERHVSTAQASGLSNFRLDLRLEPNARLAHYRLQALAASAHHVESLNATLDTAAAWTLHSLALGAQSARTTSEVVLAGADARVDWNSAALAEGEQVCDAQVTIEYRGERTAADQTFRGIAAGRSRVAFSGRMVVRPQARGADSRQSLRSLLAGPGAEADARPQLEIYTDEVRASHGATAGKLDEDMRFYLLSRGLSRETADALLKGAFVADLLARIDVPGVRAEFERLAEAQLRASGVTGDAT